MSDSVLVGLAGLLAVAVNVTAIRGQLRRSRGWHELERRRRGVRR